MRTIAFKPGITSCVSARMFNTGWTGSTSSGNLPATMLPSTCSTSNVHPATPRSGCSTTKPVRAVRKSVFCVAFNRSVVRDLLIVPFAHRVKRHRKAVGTLIDLQVGEHGRVRAPVLVAHQETDSAQHFHAAHLEVAQLRV